jgi:hypothetical protein
VMGVELFNGEGESAVEIQVSGHSVQWRSSAFDGEACYNGNGDILSVKARIKGEHGMSDVTHVISHDFAHSFDLLVQDMHKKLPYIDIIHSVIKAVYSHFSQSPLKARRLARLAEEWGVENLIKKLHYLFSVRFVASEHIAIVAFLQDLPLLIAELQDELDLEATTEKMCIEIRGWLRKMKQLKFVAHLIVLCDVHTVSKTFSKNAQSDELLIIDVPKFRSSCKCGLQKLAGELGTEAKKRVESLKEGKLRMMGKGGSEEVNLTIERRAPAPTGAEQAAMSMAQLLAHEEGEVTVVEEVAVADLITSARGQEDVEKYLLNLQKQVVTTMLGKFDERIQDPPIAHLLSKVFDFRDMPLGTADEAHAALLVHGDAEVEKLCETYFPELDVQEVKDEFLAAKMHVRENKGAYISAVDAKNPSKGTVMRICGQGSIMEAFFTSGSAGCKPITSYLHIADYMISFMWQSCCGERAGSHINAVKTKGRTLMGDDSFDDNVFCTYNFPPCYLINYPACVQRWKADGTQRMGIFKGVEEADAGKASEVIRRHLSAKASSPMFQVRS